MQEVNALQKVSGQRVGMAFEIACVAVGSKLMEGACNFFNKNRIRYWPMVETRSDVTSKVIDNFSDFFMIN